MRHLTVQFAGTVANSRCFLSNTKLKLHVQRQTVEPLAFKRIMPELYFPHGESVFLQTCQVGEPLMNGLFQFILSTASPVPPVYIQHPPFYGPKTTMGCWSIPGPHSSGWITIIFVGNDSQWCCYMFIRFRPGKSRKKTKYQANPMTHKLSYHVRKIKMKISTLTCAILRTEATLDGCCWYLWGL